MGLANSPAVRLPHVSLTATWKLTPGAMTMKGNASASAGEASATDAGRLGLPADGSVESGPSRDKFGTSTLREKGSVRKRLLVKAARWSRASVCLASAPCLSRGPYASVSPGPTYPLPSEHRATATGPRIPAAPLDTRVQYPKLTSRLLFPLSPFAESIFFISPMPRR
jgi:hypothetical protein